MLAGAALLLIVPGALGSVARLRRRRRGRRFTTIEALDRFASRLTALRSPEGTNTSVRRQQGYGMIAAERTKAPLLKGKRAFHTLPDEEAESTESRASNVGRVETNTSGNARALEAFHNAQRPERSTPARPGHPQPPAGLKTNPRKMRLRHRGDSR